MSIELGPEALAILEDIAEQLSEQNSLLADRNEMLAETIQVQRQGQQDYLDINKDAREALKMPEQINNLEQLLAQAIHLWECDVPKIPTVWRDIANSLPDPVFDGEKKDDLFTDHSRNVVDEVLDERRRQVYPEGYSTEHDDDHEEGDLAAAAACYAIYPHMIVYPNQEKVWPWGGKDGEPKIHERRRSLVIAAALLVAEIERLDRVG